MIEFLPKMQGYVISGFTAMLGGLGQYLWYLSKGKPFKWNQFAITIILAFLLGIALGSLLPEDMPARDGVMMAAGFSVYGVLQIVEERLPGVMRQLIMSLFGR